MPYAFHWLTLPDLQGSEKRFFPLEISHLQNKHFLVGSYVHNEISYTKTFLPKNVNEFSKKCRFE